MKTKWIQLVSLVRPRLLRRLLLSKMLLFVSFLLLPCSCWAAGLVVVPVGAGNNFQPLPLADGRVLFVTDRHDNLDLAIWQPQQPVVMWEDHPADDDRPQLTSDGQRVIFRSNRGVGLGWWQRSLLHGDATQFASPPASVTAPRFVARYPFDSNGDGVINHRDASWIVDRYSHLPITPLALSAADPKLDQHGHLWLSVIQNGVRQLARMDQLTKPIQPDPAIASWAEWRLLHAVRQQSSPHDADTIDAMWDAGYHKAANAALSVAVQDDLRARWQQLRAQGGTVNHIIGSAHRLMLQADRSKAGKTADRIRLDLAAWLRQQGNGAQALILLAQINNPAWRLQARLMRSDLLTEAGQPQAALQLLANADNKIDPLALPALFHQADRVLAALEKSGVTGSKLTTLLLQTKQAQLRLHWQGVLARRWMAAGAYDAALKMLSGDHLPPALARLRITTLTRHAGSQWQQHPQVALRLARQLLQADPLLLDGGRIFFAAAHRLGRQSAASAWWLKRVAADQLLSAAGRYLNALRLTHLGQQLSVARKTLKQLIIDQPQMWQAKMTLGWLLQRDHRTTAQRQALSLYQQALQQAENQHAAQWELAKIRHNLVGLAFALRLYHQQLTVMDRWWQIDPQDAAMGTLLKLQAARACYQLARYREGLAWLDRLPATIDAKQWAIALRLRALIAAVANDDRQADRTLSLLLADPDIDAGLRQRLLLNRALVAIHQRQFTRASLDIMAANRLPSDRFDRTALLRLDGLTLPFDATLITASLQADIAAAQGNWIGQAAALQGKLDALPLSTARVIALYNLALAWMRQGRWSQAVARLDEAVAASHGAHAPKLKSALQQKLNRLHLRLRAALGLAVDDGALKVVMAAAKPEQQVRWQMIALQQPIALTAAKLDPTTVVADSDVAANRISDWKQLQKSAFSLSKHLAAEVAVAYGRWLRQQGLNDAAMAVLRQAQHLGVDDPWLRWWLDSVLPSPLSDGEQARRLQQLIRLTSFAQPFHFQLIDLFYRRLAQQNLQQDAPDQALSMLLHRELRWSQLRRQAVASRPKLRASSVTKLRRGLRKNEAMALIWRQRTGTDLWWMDHQQQLYRHLDGTTPQEIAAALGDWQGGKARLYWTAIRTTPQLAQSLIRQLHGVDLVASPTLSHAVRIGRMANKQRVVTKANASETEWQDALWQQADTSVMDWRWSLQQGLHDYKRAAWRSALDAFARALPQVANRYRARLLPLIARAALRSHQYRRGLQLIPQADASSSGLRALRLTLAARDAEQQGDLVAAAMQWQQLLTDSRKSEWQTEVTAANGLAAIALRGAANLQQSLHLLQQTIHHLPAQAKLERMTLAMNSIRLQSQFHVGKWSQLKTELDALAQQVAAIHQPELRWQMALLEIAAAWHFGRNEGLQQRLRKLQHTMPADHALQFDAINQLGLLLQGVGLYDQARTAFARARRQLVHQPVAMVRERMAALHNNLGRLERASGNMERALRHFHIAMDADRQRGDRIGLLFDRKNLAGLLLEMGAWEAGSGEIGSEKSGANKGKRLATAKKLLLEAQQQAQTLRLPAIEAEVVALLLMNTLDDKNGADVTDQQQWMARMQQLTQTEHLSKFSWISKWLRGKIALAAGDRAQAEKLFRQAMVTDGIVNARLHPRRVVNDLIVMLVDHHPQQALQVALQARGEVVPPMTAGKKWRRPPLLIYVSGEQKSWCWIVDQRGVQVVSLAVGRAGIVRGIQQFNQSIARHIPLATQAHKLAAQLWLPVAARLIQKEGDITAVDVVASSPINQLSFATLRDNKGWLLDRFRFRYRQQARLGMPREHDRWSRSALAHRPWQYFVGSDAAGEPLPLADQEVAALTAFTHGAFTPIVGSRKALLSTGRNGVLHIVGHSALLAGNADGSALLLQAGERLNRAQISSRKWHNDLVVLSSCGYDWRRQQIMPKGHAIADALLRHGAKRVIAGIWQVKDLTAALTMKFFYRKLYKNQQPAQALRAAQMTIRNRFPDPADWASLRLMLR